MSSTSLSATMAARQILAFYDTIPASNHKAFSAGLVELLSACPQAVAARAASPSRGLPAFVAFPNLAKFRELLDEWSEAHWREQPRRRLAPSADARRAEPRRHPDPPPGHFANVFVPDSHARYATLCALAETAAPKFWRYGTSSDGRRGLWVSYNIWTEGAAGIKRAAAFATMTVDELLQHYGRNDRGGAPKQGTG